MTIEADLVSIGADDPGTAGLVLVVIVTGVVGEAEGPGEASQVAATLWRHSRDSVPSATPPPGGTGGARGGGAL